MTNVQHFLHCAAQTSENLVPSPVKPHQPKTPPPVRPPAPKVVVDGRPVTEKEEATLETLQAEMKELRMALDLLKRRHEWDFVFKKKLLKCSLNNYSCKSRCKTRPMWSQSTYFFSHTGKILKNWKKNWVRREVNGLSCRSVGIVESWLLARSVVNKWFVFSRRKWKVWEWSRSAKLLTDTGYTGPQCIQDVKMDKN